MRKLNILIQILLVTSFFKKSRKVELLLIVFAIFVLILEPANIKASGGR